VFITQFQQRRFSADTEHYISSTYFGQAEITHTDAGLLDTLIYAPCANKAQ